MPSDAEIGRLLKGLRQQRGLTQQRLADLVDTNHTYLSKLENGRLGTIPSTWLLAAFADVLKVDRDWLLTRCGRPPERLAESIAANPGFFQRLGSVAGGALDDHFRRETFRLVGQVPAGLPVEAVEDADEFSLADRFNPGDHFLLAVRGDSMIDDGIVDGDLAIVRAQPDCDNGQVAVVLVDGHDATLKRFYRQGPTVRLQPANETMEPLELDAERVEVRGRVVGIVRVGL